MKRQFLLLWLVSSVAISTAGCSREGSNNPESFASKREWSVLQGLELKTRGTKITEPQLLRVQEYEVLAVPEMNDGTPLWILMRAEGVPLYKQMPEGSYVISEQLVKDLASSRRISSDVESTLRAHTGSQ